MFTMMLQALAVASLATSASAVFTFSELSFGHEGRLSPANNGIIPGWDLTGDRHIPDLLSDRVILTPPYPGNRRGAVWAQKPVDVPTWMVNFDFRATGPERGFGSLQVWLTKDGASTVTTASVYTAPKFDGLAIVIDQYGGKGGSIRGFLNDGTISYRDHHSVDSLAFGQCTYAFRNRGVFSRLEMKQLVDRFQVVVDDTVCFESSKIQIPAGYYFGVTAASAENPDSFEVTKFITMAVESGDFKNPGSNANANDQTQQRMPRVGRAAQAYGNPPGSNQQPPVDNAGSNTGYASGGISQDQFNSLVTQLGAMERQFGDLMREVTQLKDKQAAKNDEMMIIMRQANEGLSGVDRMVNKINQVAHAIQRDVEGRDYQEHLSSLQDTLHETKAAISSHLPNTIKSIIKASVPSLGVFIFVVVAFQGLLAASYFFYKNRRANAPKKYL